MSHHQAKQQFTRQHSKEASKVKEQLKETLELKNWSLHFDGKHIEESEYQVIVLKNKRTEVKVDALHLKDGNADTISEGIAKVLDEYNLWTTKMIVADTTSVNTGRKSGENVFEKKWMQTTVC